MSGCSSCGASHPDVRDLDANISYWYPALAAMPAPGRALLRDRRGR